MRFELPRRTAHHKSHFGQAIGITLQLLDKLLLVVRVRTGLGQGLCSDCSRPSTKAAGPSLPGTVPVPPLHLPLLKACTSALAMALMCSPVGSLAAVRVQFLLQ